MGELLDKVLHLAVNAHHGQLDKGGNPYILHPIAVMNILHTDDEELQCIALLHDVIEDTKTTYADLIEIGCTDRIISAVMLLTKQRGQTYEQYKQGVFSSRDAMLVKIADLTHNTDIRRLKGVTEKDIARMVKYHNFYLELKDALYSC